MGRDQEDDNIKRDGLIDFNPRARMGRDLEYAIAINLTLIFQSTRPYGARRPQQPSPPHQRLISIHAPVWGATYFSDLKADATIIFQSTRPYGARLKVISKMKTSKDFNPRARMGRDLSECHLNPQAIRISIHAPVWGATVDFLVIYLAIFISIHAPVWGATKLRLEKDMTQGISIHAPVWSATWCRFRSL